MYTYICKNLIPHNIFFISALYLAIKTNSIPLVSILDMAYFNRSIGYNRSFRIFILLLSSSY